MENNEENGINKNVRNVVILIITVIAIIAIFSTLIIENKKEDDRFNTMNETTVDEWDILSGVRAAIKQYLLFPESLEIQTYDCNKSTSASNYEIWIARGSFTSKNKLNVDVRSTYQVSIKFDTTTRMMYKYIVYIDGELKYSAI